MSFDDRATKAGAALSARAAEISPNQRGLERKPWVVPLGMGSVILVAVLLVVAALNGPLSADSVEVVTANGGVARGVVVQGVRAPILGGFVSTSGEITVFTGDAQSPTVERLEAIGGAPVLGVRTVPEPRWRGDDRVIEYVSEIGGELSVVRVDVRTGRTTTEPYWLIRTSDGGISGSLQDEGTLAGSIALMSGAEGPSVTAIEDDLGNRWQLNLFGSDRSRFFDINAMRFLAPTPEGLLAVADGTVVRIDANGEVSDQQPEGVSGELVSAAGVGPSGEYAYGLMNGTVVVTGLQESRRLQLDGGADAVSIVSWGPSGETVIAQAIDNGEASLYVCDVASTTCTTLEIGAGSLVRGTPTPPQPDMYSGIWPERTQSSADAAASRDDAEQWRFDPELLTAEFAKAVLGWSDPVVAQADQIPFFPYSASFEVRPSPQQPAVRIVAAQLAGDSGWVISIVSSPTRSLNSGSSPGGLVTVGFDRQGAATVDVIVSVGDTEYSQSTADLDEVQFVVEESDGVLSSFLVLFRDDRGAVFAANSGRLNAPLRFASIG